MRSVPRSSDEYSATSHEHASAPDLHQANSHNTSTYTASSFKDAHESSNEQAIE
jgi:hypothetical protein